MQEKERRNGLDGVRMKYMRRGKRRIRNDDETRGSRNEGRKERKE